MDRSTADAEMESLLSAFIGPRWESSYSKKFRPFMSEPVFVPTWNWAAALATPFWFMYRKMYLSGLAFFIIPGMILRWLVPESSNLNPEQMMEPSNKQVLLMMFAVQLSTRLAAGGIANWLLFNRARRAINIIYSQNLMPRSDALSTLQRVGGTSPKLTFAIVALVFVFAVQMASIA